MSKWREWVLDEDTDDCPAGWYAVLVCWESYEGSFPDAMYWNGKDWQVKPGDNYLRPFAYRSPQKFEDEESAKAWANEHDPEE